VLSNFEIRFACIVATLNLSLQPRQRGYKVAGQEGGQKSLHMFPGVQIVWREWTFTFPNELPLWELKSQMDSQIFKAQLQRSKPISSKSYIPWRAAKNTIRGKVVASPKSKPWWIMWVRGCSWLILAQKMPGLCTKQLFVWFV
jgi:hypothetical protein